MRCRLTRSALTILAALILGLSFAAPSSAASADGVDCQWQSRLHRRCTLRAANPPAPGTASVADDGPKDTGTSSPCFFAPSRDGYTNVPAGPVPCSSDLGSWSNALQCYTRRADPQPDAGDPVWAGHSPEEGGAIYGCFQPLPIDVDAYLWLLSPPVPAAAGPTPRAVAEMAIEQMDLEAIEIGIVPEPRPGFVGIVGQPVWMWAANPSASTVGPITRSASAGGITVAATATIHRIVWSMGDGSTVTCSGGGTPFTDDRAGTPSPDCGYVYNTSSADQPGERFTVTASSDWVIEWAGAGQTGTIRVNDLERSVRIAVGEAQVLVTS